MFSPFVASTSLFYIVRMHIWVSVVGVSFQSRYVDNAEETEGKEGRSGVMAKLSMSNGAVLGLETARVRSYFRVVFATCNSY